MFATMTQHRPYSALTHIWEKQSDFLSMDPFPESLEPPQNSRRLSYAQPAELRSYAPVLSPIFIYSSTVSKKNMNSLRRP